LLPKGMYLERTLEVTKRELIMETDYVYGTRLLISKGR
jgi:hypothetical protein